MILPRLILGTARIAGGADKRGAIGLIRCALDAGIAAIDTAPSYGMGTAEGAVGEAIRGYDGIRITTKLGSEPPSLPLLRTAVRRMKRFIMQPESAPCVLPPKAIAEPAGNDFSPSAMTVSLMRSHERLGVIDALLLHDVSAAELSHEVLASLGELSASVNARQGYAIHAQWSEEFDLAFPAGMIAQSAPDPNWLSGTGAHPRCRELRLHSIGKTGLALAASDPQFAIALQRAARLTGADDSQTAELAALYALAAVRVPGAALLVTSSHRHRLEALLKAIASIDAEGSASRIAAQFGGQAG